MSPKDETTQTRYNPSQLGGLCVRGYVRRTSTIPPMQGVVVLVVRLACAMKHQTTDAAAAVQVQSVALPIFLIGSW